MALSISRARLLRLVCSLAIASRNSVSLSERDVIELFPLLRNGEFVDERMARRFCPQCKVREGRSTLRNAGVPCGELAIRRLSAIAIVCCAAGGRFRGAPSVEIVD